jgi:hypothetical protein
LARSKYEVSGIHSIPIQVLQFCGPATRSCHGIPQLPLSAFRPTPLPFQLQILITGKQQQPQASSVTTLQIGFLEFATIINAFRVNWVPITTAWCVLRSRMGERPAIYRIKKVKYSHYRPELAYRVGRGTSLLLNLGAIRGWVVTTTPRPLYPRERPGTHCTGGWVVLRAGLDVCKKSLPHSIPGPSSP